MLAWHRTHAHEAPTPAIRAYVRRGERGRCEAHVIAQILASGLLAGAQYALASIGLALIARVVRVINLSHGVFFAIGAYCAIEVSDRGFSSLVAVAPAAVCGACAGWLVERFLVRPVRGHALSSALILLGLAVAAESAFALVWGLSPKSVTLRLPPLPVAGTWVGAEQIIAGLAAVVLIGCLGLLLRSRLGLALRTVAANPDVAAAAGIDVGRLRTVTFAAACGFAAAAGAMLAPTLTITPTMERAGLALPLAMAVVGAPGGLRGTFLCSLGVGLVTAAFGIILQPAWEFIVALLVIILTARRAVPAWDEIRP
jgi:branched-chain amino acid transport system permease protein